MSASNLPNLFHTIAYSGVLFLAGGCAAVCLLCVFFGRQVSFVTLLSRSKQFVVDVGADVTLECEFYTDNFNLFDNPILWRKTQLGEQTQMNMMGNLMEPFAATKRFKVSFLPQPPRYVLSLSISGHFSLSVKTTAHTTRIIFRTLMI